MKLPLKRSERDGEEFGDCERVLRSWISSVSVKTLWVSGDFEIVLVMDVAVGFSGDFVRWFTAEVDFFREREWVMVFLFQIGRAHV